jgi:hypothetical protein
MGGSGGSFFGRPASEVSQLLKESVERTHDAVFDSQISETLTSLLSSYNGRNTQETAERLETIKGILGDALDGTVDTLFGGSVAKHTFVDGISDVDSLLILDKTDLADTRPRDAVTLIAERLRAALKDGEIVTAGTIAVTVTYPGGNELQLVPALRADGVLKVPAWSNNAWSEIDPQKFNDGLSKRNSECGGKVIPTIKLAKAICSLLPEDLRPSGYHLESLAVGAFRGYQGEKSLHKMLPYFFEKARTLVQQPMVDRSGQSVHVDDSLGPANSASRIQLGLALDRIARRMSHATAAKSKARWMELFGE